MKIDSLNSVPQVSSVDVKQTQNDSKKEKVTKSDDTRVSQDKGANSGVDTETKYSLDKATGLMQAIVSDKMTDKVIQKLPSDEYIKLLTTLQNISGKSGAGVNTAV